VGRENEAVGWGRRYGINAETQTLSTMRLTFSGTKLKSDYHTIIVMVVVATAKTNSICHLLFAPLLSLKKRLTISDGADNEARKINIMPK